MGPRALAQVLRPLASVFDAAAQPNLLVGLGAADDAAVYRAGEDRAVILTVDFFPPVVDDPYTYGAIAAANAMSDIYAMGGEVALALNIAAFPEDLPPAIITGILRGGAEMVASAGGVIAGGHTVLDREPKYGLCVMGFAHPHRILTKGSARAGDTVFLTKPLGTGIVLTRMQRGGASAAHAEAAIASMLMLNRDASRVAREVGVHAMTDVTGFGLLGHALEVADASKVAIDIDAAAVPLLPGALEYAREGIATGGGARNRAHVARRVRAGGIAPELYELLADPQTSGGLLFTAIPANATALAREFAAQGLMLAPIGRVRKGRGIALR